MLPTVFASYTDRNTAERLVGALLDVGVAPEDLSAVIRSNGHGPRREISEGILEVDSGENGTPVLGHRSIQSEGSNIYESRIGGGISTSSPDDDVSAVEEMDDSEEASEEMAYPDTERPYSDDDLPEIDKAADTGFYGATEPGREGLGLDPHEPVVPVFGHELSTVAIPHFALILGDGALATAVLSAGVAAQVGGRPAAGLQDYLEDEAVPTDLAFLLASDFEEGGAVVAVATPPGGIDSESLQRVLEENGARNVQLVEAID